MRTRANLLSHVLDNVGAIALALIVGLLLAPLEELQRGIPANFVLFAEVGGVVAVHLDKLDALLFELLGSSLVLGRQLFTVATPYNGTEWLD